MSTSTPSNLTGLENICMPVKNTTGHLRERPDEPHPPQPPQQSPNAPMKEPPDSPPSEPNAPVREPGPQEPKKWGVTLPGFDCQQFLFR